MTRSKATRIFRWLVLIGVIIGLTPGTWIRSAIPKANYDQILTLTPLDVPDGNIGAMEVTGAWQLNSPNSLFGSYSSLLIDDDGRFLSASDAGQLLRFPKPGAAGDVRIETFAGRTVRRKKFIDIESLTRDPETGQIWVGFEGSNAIERFDAALTKSERAEPPQMQDWPSNSGPESMARLADGRFIALSEGYNDWGGAGFPGLLFPSDPVAGAKALEFTFTPPSGYRPVDMVQIPDGRALILVRAVHFGPLPYFTSKIVLADPSAITEDALWSGEVIGEIAPPMPSDNMEGISFEENPDGSLTVWIISDDNGAGFLQRTILMRLIWDPAPPTEKAPGNTERPSKP